MTGVIIWMILAAVALLWPGRVSGPLDGIPLDTAVDVVALGLLLPLVFWWNPRFLTTRLAQGCVVGILTVKAVAALALPPDGWCATVYPSRPYVRDQTGVPHSWDVRADWRDRDPTCAAIMTRPYRRLEEFPVWFFNLPAADGNLPRNADIPPDATTRMVVAGSLTTARDGIFRLDATPGVAAAVTIDGRAGTAAEGVRLDPGSHRIVIDVRLTGDRWRLLPMWNDLSVFDAAVVTTSPPSRADLLIRPLVRWTTTALAALLLGAWVAATLRPIADRRTVGWIVMACGALAYDAIYVSQYRWHYAVAGLALSAALPLKRRARTGLGAVALIGIPWLVFVVIFGWDDIGRSMRYGVGNDFWQFQRYAYRIYLQGHWLEGGERTMWFQPLYRWIAGALHLIFGDSSVGEKLWDAAGVLTMALFAFHAVKRNAGPRWGLAAAAATLSLFMTGPSLLFVGRGLSEISSAAFIYMGAMFAMRSRAGSWRWAFAAGVCATLGFWTRLNNLRMAVAIAVFAWPVRAPAAILWTLRAWRRGLSVATLLIVPATVAAGAALFALRTWHYTGTFSVFQGTQASLLSVWQPGLTFAAGLRAAAESVAMVLSTTDPPRLHLGAVPLFVAPALALAAVVRIRPFDRLPLPLVLFALSSLAGALVARGSAYTGRFSIHVIGAMTAVLTCALARAWTALSKAARPKIEPATAA